MANIDVMYSSKSDEWATPQDIYDSLDSEFGFNLDPCATAENHKCKTFFTQTDNGLTKNWGGTRCFATRRIQTSKIGLEKPITKDIRITRLLYCLFLQGQTQNTFTIT